MALSLNFKIISLLIIGVSIIGCKTQNSNRSNALESSPNRASVSDDEESENRTPDFYYYPGGSVKSGRKYVCLGQCLPAGKWRSSNLFSECKTLKGMVEFSRLASDPILKPLLKSLDHSTSPSVVTHLDSNNPQQKRQAEALAKYFNPNSVRTATFEECVDPILNAWDEYRAAKGLDALNANRDKILGGVTATK